MADQEFESTVNWDSKAKFCKVYAKKDKNGAPYMFGELNKLNKVLVQKNTGEWAKDGEYTIYLVPVTFKKKVVQEHREQAQDSDVTDIF